MPGLDDIGFKVVEIGKDIWEGAKGSVNVDDIIVKLATAAIKDIGKYAKDGFEQYAASRKPVIKDNQSSKAKSRSRSRGYEDDLLVANTEKYLEYISDNNLDLSSSDGIVKAVTHDPRLATYIEKYTYKNAVAAVNTNGRCLEHFDVHNVGVTESGKELPFADLLRQKVCMVAVKNNPDVIEKVPADLLSNKMVDVAVKAKPKLVLKVENPTSTHILHAIRYDNTKKIFLNIANTHYSKLNHYICGKAIKKNPDNILSVPAHMLKDRWVFEAVVDNPSILSDMQISNVVRDNKVLKNKIMTTMPKEYVKYFGISDGRAVALACKEPGGTDLVRSMVDEKKKENLQKASPKKSSREKQKSDASKTSQKTKSHSLSK